jgi:hypothetical protein
MKKGSKKDETKLLRKLVSKAQKAGLKEVKVKVR